jgi:hypothetical protein
LLDYQNMALPVINTTGGGDAGLEDRLIRRLSQQ